MSANTQCPDQRIGALSPAITQRLHELQQEILREAETALAREVSAPVLRPPQQDVEVRFCSIGGDLALEVHSRDYFEDRPGPAEYELTLYRLHVVDEEHRGWQEPHTWYGSEARRDQFGHQWQRRLKRLVMDDFGTLVPTGGAQ